MAQKDRIDIQARTLNTILAVMSAALLACIARGFVALTNDEVVILWGCGAGVVCCSGVIARVFSALKNKANAVVQYD